MFFFFTWQIFLHQLFIRFNTSRYKENWTVFFGWRLNSIDVVAICLIRYKKNSYLKAVDEITDYCCRCMHENLKNFFLYIRLVACKIEKFTFVMVHAQCKCCAVWIHTRGNEKNVRCIVLLFLLFWLFQFSTFCWNISYVWWKY